MSITPISKSEISRPATGFFSIPNDIFKLICRYLNPKDVVHLGSSSRYLYFLVSDDPVWNQFVRKYFPDSYANLKIENESAAVYKHLTITEHNIKSGRYCLKTLNGHRSQINSVVVYGNKIISGSLDKTIKIWDLESGQEQQTLKGHTRPINSIVAYDGKIFSGSMDKTIKIWDLENGKNLQTLKGHQDGIIKLAICGSKLFSGTAYGAIKIWDIESGEELRTLNWNENRIRSIAVCNGMLFSGSPLGKIMIWDTESGQEIQALNAYSSVESMVVYNDMLISGLANGKIKIWDLKSRQKLRTIETLRYSVIQSLAVYDCKLILSSGIEGKVLALESGQELLTLKEHQDHVGSLIFYNGKFISISLNKVIKIWDFTSPEILNDLYNEDLLKDSFHFEYLQGVPEEAVESCGQPKNTILDKESQDRAFAKKEIIFSLLRDLFDAAQVKSKEAESKALFQIVNIWITFQKRLKDIEADFNKQCETRHGILATFSQESYAEIVKQMNALIDKFHKLNREHKVAKS